MGIEIPQDNEVRESEERRDVQDVVRRKVSSRSRRNVEVSDRSFGAGDGDFDDDGFAEAVVDGRGDLREGDGVMDEGDDSPGALSAVSADGSITRKRRKARVRAQLCFLHARDQHVVTIEKLVELGC